MTKFVDPTFEGFSSFTEGSRVRVCDSAQQLERLQREGENWKDDQKQFAGQVGTVEVCYPNGDVACSFGEKWVRLAPAVLSVEGAAPKAAAPVPAPAPAQGAVPAGVPASFASRFTQQVPAKAPPEIVPAPAPTP
eukprot:Hpha_TRINITY_DN15227_c1_g6::TRINITY_DN15227_c1_g6_i1::g.65235::m.65235